MSDEKEEVEVVVVTVAEHTKKEREEEGDDDAILTFDRLLHIQTVCMPIPQGKGFLAAERERKLYI